MIGHTTVMTPICSHDAQRPTELAAFAWQDMIRCSVDSPEVGMVFRRVGHMVSPPEALFAPDILAKVRISIDTMH